jgi:hypothetical protein
MACPEVVELVDKIAKDNVKNWQGSAARQETDSCDSIEYDAQCVGVGEKALNYPSVS